MIPWMGIVLATPSLLHAKVTAEHDVAAGLRRRHLLCHFWAIRHRDARICSDRLNCLLCSFGVFVAIRRRLKVRYVPDCLRPAAGYRVARIDRTDGRHVIASTAAYLQIRDVLRHRQVDLRHWFIARLATILGVFLVAP